MAFSTYSTHYSAMQNSSSNVTFQNYLKKESLHVKKFRKRWIVIRNATISDKTYTENNGITLHNDTIYGRESRVQGILQNVLEAKVEQHQRQMPLHVDYKLYSYKSQEMKNKPTEIIDLHQFKSIKTKNVDTFVLIHHKTPDKNRTFKSDDKSVLNKFIEIIASIIQHNSTNTAIKQAIKDGRVTYDSTTGYQYEHNVSKQTINCPNMNKIYSTNPLDCSIYHNVKEEYEFNQLNLNHLTEFTHHSSQYDNTPSCKYGDECKSYIRCENGIDKNKISDQCHMYMFRHPPRTRQIKLAKNMNSFLMNKQSKQNHELYEPTDKDYQQYKYNKEDGWLRALISEIELNKFTHDLCVSCSKNDECKHNVYQSKFSLLRVVHNKMECFRHRVMNRVLDRGNMLALILYTGCDCNYDLCASQRGGEYAKWAWFDRCLWRAIWKLSKKELG
eukprot:276668_1